MNTTKQNHPFWTSIDAVPAQYPWLANDITCDVAIIGAGISGAMCAMRFAHEDINCVLLDGETVACGQTAASAGILYYYPGCSIHQLAKEKGMDESVKVFELCASAINNVEKICEELGSSVAFCRRDLFAFSQENYCMDELKKEYLIRLHNGFSVDLMEEKECEEKFAFPVKSGLYSYNQGAEVDPFQFTHALVAKAQNMGARIYENSPIKAIIQTQDGCDVYCRNGNKVRCKKVIIATGFESDDYGTAFPAIRSTNFTIVTEPVQDFSGWYNRCILESNDDRGFVVRSTNDDRIMISGLNTILFDPANRFSGLMDFPAILEKRRYQELENKLIELFPAIRGIKPEYYYKSDVVESRDGLPVIGIDKQNPNCYYALSSGINGIVSAEIASRLLLGLYSKNATQELRLFCDSLQ